MKKLLAIFLVLSGLILAQTAPTYECRLMNDVQVSDRVYEFDVYLKNIGAVTFELANLQMGITYNSGIKNGTFTLTMIPSTSELNAAQQYTSNKLNATTAGVLKIAAMANPGAGAGSIISSEGNGTRVGRFRVTGVNAFNAASPNLGFSFSTSPYNTVVSAYYDSLGQPYAKNVTRAAGHILTGLNNPVLPVELTSFVGNVHGRDIRLDWKTATEVNSSRFEVERAEVKENAVQKEWMKVGAVTAKGNSNSPVDYSFADKKLNSGKYIYRLKMVDVDGTFQYSKIEAEVSIALPESYSVSQNYPNPFNPSTKIDYQLPEDSRVSLEIYSIGGEKVATLFNQEQTAGYYTYAISAGQIGSGLASGLYIYRLTSSGLNSDAKFVSVKKMLYLK